MVPSHHNAGDAWVVAFNRDRDFYQVPIALEEGGTLAELVTDFYLPPLGFLTRLPGLQRIAHRRSPLLPWRRVTWSWHALLTQLTRIRKARSNDERVAIFKDIDVKMSRKALKRALSKRANLFLYSGYAKEAFEDSRSAGLRKGLFVFHPHGGKSREILESDIVRHGEAASSFRTHILEIELGDSSRLDAELQAADFMICASSFTASTLPSNSVVGKRVTIAPYGCAPLDAGIVGRSRARDGNCRFLFVGQGVQRKGLHHLFKAWRKLNPSNASLLAVCSVIDPGINAMADHRSIRLSGPLSKVALTNAFLEADVFVMPSLIEGFGLVYLEALSGGAFTIGTTNTGLPDLNLPESCGRVIEAGNIDALTCVLDEAIRLKTSGELDPAGIHRFATGCSWKQFRSAIRHACGGRDRPSD